MSLVLWQTIKIARRLAKTDPVLGYELERSAIAIVNPGAKSFEQDLANTVSTLEGLEKELEAALEDIDSMDAKEFANYFDDAVEAEEEQLRQMLKKASTVAGFMDFFKKKKKPKEEPKEDAPGAKDDKDAKANEPSYHMDDDSMDEFVEGKKEWKDPGHYVEQEANENKEFMGGVKKVLDDMDKIREKPTRETVQGIMKRVQELIKKGKDMMKGAREHLKKPDTKVEVTEEGRQEPKPGAGKKLSPGDLERLVDHYTDMLKESLGDQGKTVKFLKDLFRDVGPAIHEERAEIAAVRKKMAIMLVHLANMNYELRPQLFPVIRRLANLRR